MTNKLAGENSPYLLQHAENPVDWYPWGPEALEIASHEEKPIFLSIGYSACHWCHVMAHESFEDPQIAELMNRNFVNIKVDREERPDLDNIYMNAVVSMTGQGGWPMSLFLTQNGQPFYGGTYFPPVRRYNMPSFREVLEAVARAWQQKRDEVLQSAEDITSALRSAERLEAQTQVLSHEALKGATLVLAQSYDWTHGGWGSAPKFPQPMAIEFLLRRATPGKRETGLNEDSTASSGDPFALEIALHALKAMAKGGMYDVAEGGFARYSTDNEWLIPHFEKMLYDNAQLARAYLHAFLITRQDPFLHACVETLDFLLREMMDPQGGFYSSLDADSEGEEGKYYLWSMEDIRQAIPAGQMEFFQAAYPVTENGNFEGKNILQRGMDDEQLAERFHISEEQVRSRLTDLHRLLLERRERQIRPGTDDKALTAWNALALAAFAEAARYLGRSDYLEAAIRNASFLIAALHLQDRLLRSWRKGQAKHHAYLEDYAALILGLLELYQSDPNPRWFQTAQSLAEEMLKHYRDIQGGFFDTCDDAEELVARPKDIQDNATPSGNSLAALALLELSAYTGRGDYRDLAESMLGSIQAIAAKHPTAFAQWLSAIDFALGPVDEVAILGEAGDARLQEMINSLWSAYRPRLVAAISSYPPPEGSPPLLADRPLLDHTATAYVCQGFVCQRPVNAREAFLEQLS
jgi:uncharacterized protein